MQRSGDPPSSKNCISDHNGFCKTHRRLGKMVDVTKKDMKLDENSKKFEVKLSTIQEFTCIDKTDVTKKDIKLDENSKKFEVKLSTIKGFTCSDKAKTRQVPNIATSQSSADILDCTKAAMIDYGVNNGRKLSRTVPVSELRRCYERNAM